MGSNKKFKKINEYFGLNFPLWMESRKTLFVFAFLDFLIIYIFLRDRSFNTIEYIYTGRSITFLLIWTLLSYITGRYSFYRNLKSNNIKLYKLFTNTIIVFLLTFSIDKTLIIFFDSWIPLGRDDGIKIFIFTYLIQSIKFILENYSSKKIYIYLVGNNNQIEKFKNDFNFYIKSKKIILNEISDFDGDLHKLKTFLLLNNDYEKFYESYSYLINENSEIINASDWCEKNLNRIPCEYLSNNDFNYSVSNYSQNINWRIKRLGDIIISLFLLITTSPIIILFSILIKLEDNGPIFYKQYRTGLYGKKFIIVKLRSMKDNSEKNGAVWAKKNDPRVTKIGRILRQTRIDELPQLWPVFIGDMSLIGPRPERPEIEKYLIKEIPFYKFRNTIRPGLSGWAQVNYNYGASVEDSKKKFSYEVFYLKNFSLFLDLLIFFKTIKLVIRMEGSDPKSDDN